MDSETDTSKNKKKNGLWESLSLHIRTRGLAAAWKNIVIFQKI